MSHQLTQRFVSAEKIIFSNFRSTIVLRNTFYGLCMGTYILLTIVTLNFPVSNNVLFALIMGGLLLMAIIHNLTRPWASCFITAETLVCKHLNKRNSVIPIYSIKSVRTRSMGLFYLTCVEFRLDGKKQKVHLVKRTHSTDLEKAIHQIKESIKKANL